MGTVYKARDLVLERVVAVKLLHRHDAALQGAADRKGRFLNEARAVARLNHPAIVALFDFSDADPAESYFAMEYVDGRTIEDHMREAPGPRLPRALELMRQLLGGLGYAHAQGVIHRDIKPSNLLVTRDGRLKITDFGIAKVGSLKQTQTGVMIGTPAYMAPERYLGREVDRRCDLYSAGVLFFELLTGRRPFSGQLSEIMYQICHVAPRAVSSAAPAVPQLLDPVLAKSLAKDPDDRYQSAQEFADAIADVVENLGLGRGAAHLSSELRSEQAGASVAATQLHAIEGWSGEELAEIERQLTPILGPMARIVVKRAAASTLDRERLYQELAAQLRSEDERQGFLKARSAARASSAAITGTPQSPAGAGLGAAKAAAITAIDAHALERTTRALTRYLGPIAAVLVRKAASAALDEADLQARLAARIADARERARFIAECRGASR